MKEFPLAPEVPLCNRYDALGLEKGKGLGNSPYPGGHNHIKLVQSSTQIRSCTKKKKKRKAKNVTNWGLLTKSHWGIHLTSKQSLCLPGSHIHNNKKRLPGLIKPEKYYTFPLFQTRLHKATMWRLKNIKRNFLSLRKMLKGYGAQSSLSSQLEEWDLGRRRQTH